MDAALGFGRQMAPRMMDRGFDGSLAGHGLFLGIGLLVLAAIVVALIVWAVTRKPSAAGPTNVAVPMAPTIAVAPTAADSALDIARTRLARGEIDVEQYKAIAEALGGQPPT